MKMKPLPLLFSFLMVFVNLQAQNSYEVLLQTGTIVPIENVKAFIDHQTIPQSEVIEGHFYRLLQFEKIPTNEEHQVIAQTGIQLLEYLPHLTYLAAIPAPLDLSILEMIGVRSVLPIDQNLKIDQTLIDQPYGEWAVNGSQITVMIKYHKNLRQEQLMERLAGDGIQILKANGVNNFLLARIEKEQIESVAQLPYIAYLELQSPPGVPEDTEGRSLHRSNALDTSMPSGRKYTGEGVRVCVRDDGDVGPHIDFQGRMVSDFVGDERGTHGDGVSGILCGAGNLDPTKRGMAAGAELYVLSYEATFLDTTLSLHVDENVLVTNSSYSNGCNVGYTAITATVDQQMYDYPTFLHIFSAGNSNNQNCNYGAGAEWGNITGGHKQGKNVIATANVFSDGSLVESSSRGPAHDGRIKPDIAANGQEQYSTDPNNAYDPFGGTSGAAPGIAGITAQLHQAYSDLNGGATADAALLKAVLLNSANDAGNIGPDFKFGWGIVNAYRAALTLEENRYFTGSVDPGQMQTHEIEIPAGVTQVKVMTYWREQESAVMVTKALVNDIDTRLTSSFGNYQPWVLDPTPNPNTLDLPANKGIDDLNNVEQVAVDNPTAGTYTLEVTGTELPFGTQEYFVVYEFITNQHTITYPVGGEGVVPGEVERIHWDAVGDQGNWIIVYSTDGGNSWLLVANVPGADRMYEWTVPDEVTAKGRLMIVRGAVTSMSEDFTISHQPQNLTVGEVCPDYIRLDWDAVTDATEYELFRLGEKYMDPIGTSTTNTFDFPISDPTESHWFAIRTIGADGFASRRTTAIFYDGGLMNCVVQNDMSVNEVLVPAADVAFTCGGGLDQAISILVSNNGAVEQTDVMVAAQIDNETPIVEPLGMTLQPGETATHVFSSPLVTSVLGNHTISAWVTIADDNYLGNDTTQISITVVDGAGTASPIVEDFESGVFPPANWQLINPDGGVTWETVEAVERSGDMGMVMRVKNYGYPSAEFAPQEDVMYTFPIDLSAAPADIGVSFDLAYAPYGIAGFDDELRIELSTDCGESFPIVIYDKAGPELETAPAPPFLGQFFPTASSDWENEVVSLEDYVGSTIVLKFVSVSHFGNNLHIDNINVTGLSPDAQIVLSDEEICVGGSLNVLSTSQGGDLIYFWDFGMGAFPMTSSLGGPFNINYSMAGEITVSLLVSNELGTSTTSMTVNVVDTPVPDFSYNNNLLTIDYANTSVWGSTYAWDFGDGNGSTDENPSHTYAAEGTYPVTLEVTNACGTESITYDVLVSSTGINDTDPTFAMEVVPNPNNGVFDLVLNSAVALDLDWRLHNLQGQMLKDGLLITQVGQTPNRIDVSDLTPGIYLLQVNSKTGSETIKVVLF